jgi:hypothetical protein
VPLNERSLAEIAALQLHEIEAARALVLGWPLEPLRPSGEP